MGLVGTTCAAAHSILNERLRRCRRVLEQSAEASEILDASFSSVFLAHHLRFSASLGSTHGFQYMHETYRHECVNTGEFNSLGAVPRLVEPIVSTESSEDRLTECARNAVVAASAQITEYSVTLLIREPA